MPPFASPPNPKAFQATVWEIARQIPEGKVSTYGQIASIIPPPGTLTLKDYEAFGPRWVGGAMAACPDDVPWQRVINSQGKISPRPGAELQKELLRAEGVFFNEKGKIDFETYGWNGPDPEWCKERGLVMPNPLSKGQGRLF
jgi:methylated-DNA-protein-cysteine methyltransferase related protein